MNKEIKEILSFKEDIDYKRLSIEDILLLKEYITNLQEKLNLAENILYDYLYEDKKITKELYDKFKGSDKE